ncbi:hypothetical protein [Amycolatopsis kentuckyensis]|uniref:hypothetical protein n=1 Tax=Amycolatopsis kentuckyensis TaxID=218823 RepID=UPI00356A8206
MTDDDHFDAEDSRLDEGFALLREEAADSAEKVSREFWRRYWPWIAFGMATLAIIVSVIVSVTVGPALSGLYARQDSQDAAISYLRSQADAAKTAGDRANAELSRRGQAQVPIPNPGQASDTDVIVSAATARVLASLPSVRPTAAELGAGIARYVADNPITVPGPTPMQISASLAGYLATNPPPAGPTGAAGRDGQQGPKGDKGDRGEQGPAPTTEQIQDAFASYLREHPEALCPKGGTFAQVRVVLANGGTADTYTCVVATNPPSPASSTTAQPSLLPIPGG